MKMFDHEYGAADRIPCVQNDCSNGDDDDDFCPQGKLIAKTLTSNFNCLP